MPKPNFSDLQNILWDLDGTLTDPYTGITNSIKYALNALNIESSEDLSWCIGPPLQESFAKILEKSRDSKEVEEAVRLYRVYFADKGMFENRVYSGIEEVLKKLKASNKTLYVATSKPHIYATKILEHYKLSSYFTKIYGAELNGVRANKVELIKYLLDKESIIPSTSIMIGDRKHDLIGAIQNQVRCLGVTWGYGSLEELESQNPDGICTDVNDLLDFLA